MGSSHVMNQHFDRVAPVYDRIRATDPDIVQAIISRLPRCAGPIHVADIGCGSGRYSHLFVDHLKENLRIFCCDYSGAMLEECRKRTGSAAVPWGEHYFRIRATALPFADGFLDAIVTFNAVHHFDLNQFIKEASRTLRLGGLLAIYTRTPHQNRRNIWGQHFPGFADREIRLYSRERLKQAIRDVPELQLEHIQEFRFARTDSLESFLEKMHHFHYSTFALFSEDELVEARRTFVEQVRTLQNSGMIQHTAENILVLARRTYGQEFLAEWME